MRDILIARHRLGSFDTEAFKSSMENVDKSHDGVIVAQAFLRFLLE